MTDNPPRNESHAAGFEGYEIAEQIVFEDVHGLRSFDMYDGGLHGITFPQEWLPGINYAHCYNAERLSATKHLQEIARASRWRFVAGMTRPKPCPAPIEPGPDSPEHRMGPCSCGWWAFHTVPSANWYLRRPNRAGGVIRLSGRVLPGTKGWRGSRAEIVALIRPESDVWCQDTWEEIVARFRVPTFSTRDEALEAFPLTVPDAWMLPEPVVEVVLDE